MSCPLDNLEIAIAQINPRVGDLNGNADLIISESLQHQYIDLIIFPELCVTGYPPEDLLFDHYFIDQTQQAIQHIAAQTKELHCAILISAPTRENNYLYNSAILIHEGHVQGVRHKHKLPNNGVFDEKRYFTAGPLPEILSFKDFSLGVMTCEDLWTDDVSNHLAKQGADLLIALNASPYDNGKQAERFEIAKARCREAQLPLVYVNQVGGQDSLVFDGESFVMNIDGTLRHMLPSFASLSQDLSQPCLNFTPSEEECFYKACVLGTRDYVHKNGFHKIILGVSGGIDSALVAAIAVDALGAENVHGYMLPSKYTSVESFEDANTLATNLNFAIDELDIENTLKDFHALLPKDAPGLMFENLQSRARGVLLMALSNASGALLLSTGNKSEMACGYATLYGDMNGAYNPIKDLYKTRVYDVCKWLNTRDEKNIIPPRIITKAPSAELRDGQTDQDSLPPYDMLDTIICDLIENHMAPNDIAETHGFDIDVISRVARMIRLAEYKRRQSCPGPKLTRNAFDRERRYPITNGFVS